MSGPAKVYLTIDTLALAGFDPQQRRAIIEALQADLARQLAVPENLAALGASRSLARVKAQPFPLPAGANARQIAAESSRQLLGSLTSAHAAGTGQR